MKIRLKIDTDNIHDLIALKQMADHYLSLPAPTPYEAEMESYGGIERSTANYWGEKTEEIEKLERMQALIVKDNDAVLHALAKEHWDNVDRKLQVMVKEQSDRAYYGDGSTVVGGLADLIPDDPDIVNNGTRLIDNAVKKRSVTDGWDRYR